MTIRDIIRRHRGTIGSSETILLIANALNKEKEFVMAHPEYACNNAQSRRIASFIRQRSTGVPIAYLLKEKEFYGLTFFVNLRVLIPRPETELLVEQCLIPISDTVGLKKKTLILDIGTGSGCIALSVAREMRNKNMIPSEQVQIAASDISDPALRVAKKNALNHGLEKVIRFFKSDTLLNPSMRGMIQKIKPENIYILANLPYVSSLYLDNAKSESTRGLKFEPRLALDGGADGLDTYRKLMEELVVLKNCESKTKIECFFEIGNEQENIIKKNIIPKYHINKFHFHADLSKNPRVFSFQLD